ncbi:hypothetical protein LTR22_023290 [Elasticomyces elasticus]|nr:hypothetical protein LTR22_023290 [Elasticomyces elasticus]
MEKQSVFITWGLGSAFVILCPLQNQSLILHPRKFANWNDENGSLQLPISRASTRAWRGGSNHNDHSISSDHSDYQDVHDLARGLDPLHYYDADKLDFPGANTESLDIDCPDDQLRHRFPASTITSVIYVTAYTTVSQGGSTVSSVKTVSSVLTETEAQTISTSYKVITSTSVTTAAQQTMTFVNSADSTVKLITTLPASTKTTFKTVTAKGSTVTSTITAAPSTETNTVKATSTSFSSVTKSSSNAPACTA